MFTQLFDKDALMHCADIPWQSLFDLLPDGVMILDPETTRPLFFNHAACSQLGYSAEEFGQVKISDYEALETPEQTQAHVERLMQHKRDDFITRHRRKDGRLRDVRVTVVVQTLRQIPVFLAVFRDITDLLQAEEQGRAKNDFLTGVSHQLRTPLNAILGYAQLMEMQQGVAEVMRENAREISRAGRQMLDLLNGVLELAQLEQEAKEKQDQEAAPLDPTPAASGTTRAQVAPPAGQASARILVVEDHPANQILLKQQLRRLGCEVDLVADGQAALERWREGSYELILTDLNMPRMDGCQLARSIREEMGGPGLPIVAITAAAISEELDRCRAAGMDDTLTKPVTLEQLEAMLQRWLPGELSARRSAPAQAKPSPSGPPTTPVMAPAMTPETAERVLDIAQLHRLLGSQDAGLCSEILHSFLHNTRAGLAALRDQGSQPEAIAQEMHKQKSSARTIGALDYAQRVAYLEQQARQGQAKLTELAALLPALDAIERAVNDYLNSHANPATAPAVALSADLAMSVLVVDDDPVLLLQISALLDRIGVQRVATASTGREALGRLLHSPEVFELLICDLNMPEMDGVEFTRTLAEQGYQGGILLISGEDGRTLQAAENLIAGQGLQVAGSLAKPVSQAALQPLLQRLAPKEQRQARPLHDKGYSANRLRQAISQGELENHYQPKIDLKSGRWIGVESLVRWRHPIDGLIFPDRFIGLAEVHGLIEDLTRAVLDLALQQAQLWQALGLDLRVAVNVSMDNLSDLDFPDRLVRQVVEAGLTPDRITLEITESRLMRDRLTVLDILTRLRLKKFHLSIDDFGTGHSSLSQLRDLPFDELKVDRSFVHKAAADPTKRAIYEASLQMGQQIGMEVVGEGVEDHADWDFLRHSGCHIAQGYFIAKPMPASQLLDWHQSWQQRLDQEGLVS
jgi:PAS domain S-box-containing protein